MILLSLSLSFCIYVSTNDEFSLSLIPSWLFSSRTEMCSFAMRVEQRESDEISFLSLSLSVHICMACSLSGRRESIDAYVWTNIARERERERKKTYTLRLWWNKKRTGRWQSFLISRARARATSFYWCLTNSARKKKNEVEGTQREKKQFSLRACLKQTKKRKKKKERKECALCI
jgi:hypothetical protein